MKDLLKSYKETQKKIMCRIKQIDYELKHNIGCKQYNIKLRAVYEREYMEVTQAIIEIEHYLKEVSK